MMPKRRPIGVVVIALTSVAILPLLGVFASGNLRWINSLAGQLLLIVVMLGLLVGVLGGIGLAVSRKNPLWLIVTIMALCAAYFWFLVMVGVGMGRMH